MSRPFPTFQLSRKPTRSSWTEEVLFDPTIRGAFESGYPYSRGRFTALLKKFGFSYNYLTGGDKILIEQHEEHVVVGASKFPFRHPDTDEDWEVRLFKAIKYSREPRLPNTWRADIIIFGKEISKMKTQQVLIGSLSLSGDLTNFPIFVNRQAVTINSIGILTQGAPSGIDDSNTCVLTVKDDGGNTVVSKTYNTSTQPPSSDYEDLGTLSNNSLNAGEHLTLTVVQGVTSNIPAFSLVIEYYIT